MADDEENIGIRDLAASYESRAEGWWERRRFAARMALNLISGSLLAVVVRGSVPFIQSAIARAQAALFPSPITVGQILFMTFVFAYGSFLINVIILITVWRDGSLMSTSTDGGSPREPFYMRRWFWVMNAVVFAAVGYGVAEPFGYYAGFIGAAIGFTLGDEFTRRLRRFSVGSQ